MKTGLEQIWPQLVSVPYPYMPGLDYSQRKKERQELIGRMGWPGGSMQMVTEQRREEEGQRPQCGALGLGRGWHPIPAEAGPPQGCASGLCPDTGAPAAVLLH